MPDLDKTIKGHLKEQRQGIRSTKQRALDKLVEDEQERIKIEGENTPYTPLANTKLNDIFVRVEDLSEEIHTD